MNYPIHLKLEENSEEIKNEQVILFSNETGFAPLTNYVSGRPIAKSYALRKVVNELNKRVGVAAFKIKGNSSAKGFIVASGQRSEVYKLFAEPNYGSLYRDFFYAVQYQAYELCNEVFKHDNLAITHLTGGGVRKEHFRDVSKTAAEALKHFRFINPESDFSITFGGCCFEEEHFEGLEAFYHQVDETAHRSLSTSRKTFSDRLIEVTIDFIDIL
ncbi:MAG: hypothetical protein WC967_11540 [Balneolaceae bacterium]